MIHPFKTIGFGLEIYMLTNTDFNTNLVTQTQDKQKKTKWIKEDSQT